MSDVTITHRVVVPIDGMTVTQAKARASKLGVDPDSPEARLVGLEAPTVIWEAVVRFQIGATGAVPTGLELRSTDGRRITRKAWEAVRMAAVLDEAVNLVNWLAPISKQPGMEKALDSARRPTRRGRPRVYSDEELRNVAMVYLAAQASEDQKIRSAPVRAVAKAFEGKYPGLTGTKDRRARSMVRAARTIGFLPEVR